ncbi:hypothetical protein G7Z17_g11565 [Cylindrodendrum hubeiense]|uniref:Uncharacterized protein n=1 Tax=Cylindrodendrum hubeiense TaxID=595255 RepID=A0A9P5GWW2_9HYPO|nr:hypothetical protein G7Z17_g11565 [Cylindrodendrum hubeiense]
MYWVPLSAEAVLLGALLHNVNAMVPRYHPAREEHVRAMPTATAAAMALDDLMSIAGHDLRYRAAETTTDIFTLTVSPDETCGYLSGSAGVGITCDNGALCSWEVTSIGAILCGATGYVQCIPMSIATDSEQCNDVCQSNSFNLICTDTASPYCRTYDFPSGVRDYRCAPTPVTAVQSADFTWDGQSDPQFITTVLDDETISTSSSSTTSTTTTTTSSSSTDPVPGPTDPPVPKPKSKTPIGAIVGGAVGGVAVIALIVFGVIYMLRKNKKPKDPAANTGPAYIAPTNFGPPPTDQQQMQMVGSLDVKTAMPNSPVQSVHPDWQRQSMAAPNTAVSPISQAGWGHPQPFPTPVPAPAYEAPGHEARERDPVYEMGDDSATRK